MSEGWIKIHRKIFENKFYFSEPFNKIMAWIDLLLLANHSDKIFFIRGIGVEVKRGQIGYGVEKLSERWKWSRGKCERFLKQLENEQQIVRQKNNVTTLISIVNYDIYQTDDNANSKASSKPNDKANGQQTVKQTDINNNDKNNKNEKNEEEDEIFSEPNLKDLSEDQKRMYQRMVNESFEWHQVLYNTFNFKSHYHIKSSLDTFLRAQFAAGGFIRTIVDYKSHFVNWIKTKNGGEVRQLTQSEIKQKPALENE